MQHLEKCDLQSTKTSHFRRPLTLALASLVIGCMPADDDGSTNEDQGAEQPTEVTPSLDVPHEAQLNLVAEVKQPGLHIKWFAPEPGLLMELELEHRDLHFEPRSGLNMLDRYKELTGEEAPRALREAHERVNAMRANAPASAQEPVEQSAVPEEAPIPGVASEKARHGGPTTWAAFDASYCVPTDRYWGNGQGLVYTQPTSFSAKTEYFAAGVYVYTGSVCAIQNCANDSLNELGCESTNLNAGWYKSIRCSSSVDRRTESQVYNISGQYRHCINYHY